MSVSDETQYKISTNTQNGAGEREWCHSCLLHKENDYTYKTVFQILNDIVDKAVDIVLKKNNKEDTVVNNKINVNAVSNILENIFSEISKNNATNTISERMNETNLLDDEIKKLINEMKYPPNPLQPPMKGVGDQKTDNEGTVLSQPSPKQFEIEKKTALTNLVRNSKQFLSKFILNENIKPSTAENEDTSEMLLNVIELDCVNDKDSPYVAASKIISPSNNDNVQLPNDNLMDVIELFSNSVDGSNEENRSLSIAEPSKCFEKTTEASKELNKKKKKKWNLGVKFLNIIRRNSKKNENTASASQEH